VRVLCSVNPSSKALLRTGNGENLKVVSIFTGRQRHARRAPQTKRGVRQTNRRDLSNE
jgi:hypothetical protein